MFGNVVMLVMVLQLPPDAASSSREDPVAVWPLIQKLTLVGLEKAGVWTEAPVFVIFSDGAAVP